MQRVLCRIDEMIIFVFMNETTKPEGLQKAQRLIIDLALGAREPQNEKEVELLNEIKQIEARGHMLDLPLE
jgi:hypothetical protein